MLRQTFAYLVNSAILYSLLLVTYLANQTFVTFSQSESHTQSHSTIGQCLLYYDSHCCIFSFVCSWQKPTWLKCPASVVIDSATYLLTISMSIVYVCVCVPHRSQCCDATQKAYQHKLSEANRGEGEFPPVRTFR